MRRYKEERKKALSKFFTDIGQEFPETNLKVKGDNFYINDEIAGYSAVLTQAQDYKGSAYTDVKNIIFDEYPIEKNKRYYLPNEGMIIMGIFDSILRNRSDVKIFILGNATNDIEFSPLFTFFNLELPYNNDIRLFKENTILVQYMKNDEFRQERKNTLIGKLSKGTEYEQYAIENKILNKNNDFIEIEINGNGFMRSMVRMIVGVLFANASGIVDDKYILDLLDSNERKVTKYNAPANGLYLKEVFYE